MSGDRNGSTLAGFALVRICLGDGLETTTSNTCGASATSDAITALIVHMFRDCLTYPLLPCALPTPSWPGAAIRLWLLRSIWRRQLLDNYGCHPQSHRQRLAYPPTASRRVVVSTIAIRSALVIKPGASMCDVPFVFGFGISGGRPCLDSLHAGWCHGRWGIP